MASNTKPHVAILGSGPTGLEAALTAHERGFPFTLYESAPSVAGHIRSWRHVRLFTPWSLNISPRARRALEAAAVSLPAPDSTECPTGGELVDQILEPLAALPEIKPCIRCGVRVTAIGRQGLVKNEEIGTATRGERPFRLLLADDSDRNWTENTGVVLDCTGTYGNPNATGDGGIPAPGEDLLHTEIVRTLPDVFSNIDSWAGKTILVVGAGHSAQTAVADLAALAEKHPETHTVWALRRSQPTWNFDPDDPLPSRAALARRASDLGAGSSPAVEVRCGVVVDELRKKSGAVEVTLRNASGERSSLSVDRVLSLTGGAGDHTLYRQLQVHECYATSGPMKLAAVLLGQSSADCLAQEAHGADTLVNPEPGFFILGSKSYGRNNTFLMRVGWEQVEEVFGLLDDR
ncbi:MAG: NAD(P)-binding protein [Acidobacteriota bacterium]|nr:NAD(P)-binding protein [Acidobacteriota bacterium]